MANFDDKILYLKNLLPEDGVGEVLERLKLMLIQNKQRVNEIIQLETRLSKLNNDIRFQFITKEAFNSEYALLTKAIIDYLDELKPEDLETQTTKTKKKNSGHLLRRIPDQMQLQKRTKCVVRLAHLQEELLENYEMTEDTIIKSVRVAEVMEVDLQDRNEEKSFEITTPNTKDQFLDEGYYTEWIYYVKPIREGQHELTLVVSVLEEIRGKERRRDVVLEEVVTIVTEEVITDELYKSTGYEVGSSKTITPQPFLGFQFRKIAAAFILLIVGTLGIWAFTTESGQYQMAALQDDKSSYENFLNKYENSESKYTQKALQKVETFTYTDAIAAAENGDTKELLAFVEKYPESKYSPNAIDKLIGIEYDLIASNETVRNTEPLVDFIKRYQHIETPKNKEIQTKARLKYKNITNTEITNKILEQSPAKPLRIKGFIKNNSLNDLRLIDSSLIQNDIKNQLPTIKTTPNNKIEIPEKTTTKPTIKKTIIPNKIQTDKIILYQADNFAHQMVRVQGGTFQMGSTKGKSNEKPVHTVKLKSFSISKYEITQKQWREIMGKNNDNYHKNCDNCPVDNVSWKDANNFIQTLNKKIGRNYRLPTEAEWEYAARGGQKSKNFTFAGSNNINDVAWYSKNSNRKTYKVGSKRPNELGLYDMSGNVYEWCSDWYDKNYYKNSPTSNPKNTNSNNRYHVLRGGSWFNYAKYCRTTARRTNTDDNEYTMNGFRLVHD
ncbi:MAG: SUMF1/EgtB/PvdO family nonheme iron enzyme [Saprospiraceae bacterium]